MQRFDIEWHGRAPAAFFFFFQHRRYSQKGKANLLAAGVFFQYLMVCWRLRGNYCMVLISLQNAPLFSYLLHSREARKMKPGSHQAGNQMCKHLPVLLLHHTAMAIHLGSLAREW